MDARVAEVADLLDALAGLLAAAGWDYWPHEWRRVAAEIRRTGQPHVAYLETWINGRSPFFEGLYNDFGATVSEQRPGTLWPTLARLHELVQSLRKDHGARA